MRFGSFHAHLLAALGCSATYHLLWREASYKLADQVLVHADFIGFRALAAEHPFGAIDWCVRMLAATDLLWWGVLVQLLLVAAVSTLAHSALRRRGSPFAPFAPWIVAIVGIFPSLSLGKEIWMVPHPHFVQMHLLWLAVLSLCLFAGWKGLLVFLAIPFALAFAGRYLYYDLGPHETLWSAWTLPVRNGWDLRSALVALAFVALTVLAFVRRPAVLPRWSHAVVIAFVAFLLGFFVPTFDNRDQLQMERAVDEGRFADVLEIAPQKPDPEWMETAWRVLAMFRTDCIDRDLHRYPIVNTYRDEDFAEEEMPMGGPLLLFNYGLILPARCMIFDIATGRGWQPRCYRILADIALITGENELARKNLEEYARFPFRGDFARRRLALMKMTPPPPDAFRDLFEVAGMYDVWCDNAKLSADKRYFMNDTYAEGLAYSLFQKLEQCPPKMYKMFFASAILEGHPERVKQNQAALKSLYPDGRIGPVFLEALK